LESKNIQRIPAINIINTTTTTAAAAAATTTLPKNDKDTDRQTEREREREREREISTVSTSDFRFNSQECQHTTNIFHRLKKVLKNDVKLNPFLSQETLSNEADT
jgi:hypothetical protein